MGVICWLVSGRETLEAGGTGVQQAYDRVKQALYMETDRGTARRQAMLAVRKGGTLSILGVYGLMDKVPLGLLMNKGITVRTAQQHGQAYVPRLLEYTQRGELTPAALATHRFPLEQAVEALTASTDRSSGSIKTHIEDGDAQVGAGKAISRL